MIAPQSEQLGASSECWTPARFGSRESGLAVPYCRFSTPYSLSGLFGGSVELRRQLGRVRHFDAVRRGDTHVFARLGVFRQELEGQPAEDIIHQRLGVADVAVRRPAAGLEARVAELVAQHLERNAILQRQ